MEYEIKRNFNHNLNIVVFSFKNFKILGRLAKIGQNFNKIANSMWGIKLKRILTKAEYSVHFLEIFKFFDLGVQKCIKNVKIL